MKTFTLHIDEGGIQNDKLSALTFATNTHARSQRGSLGLHIQKQKREDHRKSATKQRAKKKEIKRRRDGMGWDATNEIDVEWDLL